MDVGDYLRLVAKRIDVAEAEGNKEEILRLLKVLTDTVDDVVKELMN